MRLARCHATRAAPPAGCASHRLSAQFPRDPSGMPFAVNIRPSRPSADSSDRLLGAPRQTGSWCMPLGRFLPRWHANFRRTSDKMTPRWWRNGFFRSDGWKQPMNRFPVQVPAERLPRDAHSLDAAADAQISKWHGHAPHSSSRCHEA